MEKIIYSLIITLLLINLYILADLSSRVQTIEHTLLYEYEIEK